MDAPGRPVDRNRWDQLDAAIMLLLEMNKRDHPGSQLALWFCQPPIVAPANAGW